MSAFSPTQAWAVGDIYSPLTPIIYRWNGTAWRKSSPGLLTDSSLRDVVTTSANDAWAVGYQQDAGAGDLTVTLHWDGVKWARVSSPSPSDENYLNGVAAVGANDVWAVGYKGTSTLYGTLILHWNGNAWTESPTRGSGYRVLTDVAALAPNDVWAIGYKFSFNTGYQGLAMHWNGTRWLDVAVPVSDNGYTLLNGLTAISPTDIWAVGQGGTTPIKPVAAHWDGTAWTYVSNPELPTDYAFFKSVTALGSDDVWAAGYFTDDTGIDRNLVEHWNGSAWTQTAVPEMDQAHNELWAIAPDGAAGLWAVGSFLPADFSRPLSSLVLRGSP
ncbi:MAG TPA: hypothetical protein VH207_12730 [Chthoniobacterales bacterium]|nr:hypothetical protein [Chthoniobacterales bacterium]